MKISLSVLFVLALAIPAAAQTYIGGGVGIGRSTSDFEPRPIEIFGVGQKKAGRFHLRGLGGIRTQPQLPTLFQEGMKGYEQDGYELFARPEIDLTFLHVGPLQGFVGAGGDYFYQAFSNEPGGKDNHYHSGLNPLASAGTRFKAFGGSHRIAATRIFQELKIRDFPYITAAKPMARLKPLQHKGTLNPSYLEGWRLGYEYLKPIGKGFSFYGAAEGNYYKYKEFPLKTFGDNYYETDAVVAFRFGVIYQ